jgi:hypothetical protein
MNNSIVWMTCQGFKNVGVKIGKGKVIPIYAMKSYGGTEE